MNDAGQQLPARIVDAVLEQRLAEALCKAAVDLALDDHWVDDGADIVDAPKADDSNLAGVAIDLDLAHMSAVAEGEIRRIIDRVVLPARAPASERKVGAEHRRRARPRANDTRRSVPATAKVPSAKSMSPARCFQQVSRDPLALGRSIFIAARSSAEPPTAIEREPNVPDAIGHRSVSPSMTSTLAIGTPSRDDNDLGKRRGVTLAVIVGAE